MYRCVGCRTDLFSSEAKYDSRSGWPSYGAPVALENIRTAEDRGFFMVRTEGLCRRCDAHLGHVFPDGPPPAEKPVGPSPGLSCPAPGPNGGTNKPAAPERLVIGSPPPIDAPTGAPTEVATFALG